MNKVFLNGYLATDPKQRVTTKGIEQSSFSIGVTDLRNYNDSYFFQCVAWGPQAKYINNNLKKGSFVAIDGRLTRRSYVDGEGKTIYITEIVIDNIKHFGINNKTISQTTQQASNQDLDVLESLETTTNIGDVLNDLETNEQSNNEIKSFDWDEDLE